MAGVFPFGLSERNSGVFCSSLAQVDQMRLVGQPNLLEHDRDLHAVRPAQRIELQTRAPHATHVTTGDRLWSTLPHLRPGDFIEFFAEMDLLCALSACPGGDCSATHSSDAAQCWPLKVEVWRGR